MFFEDLTYIQLFVTEHFGKFNILLNKNNGEFLSGDYSIKYSRIKGYAFHGHGCLFQFKRYHIDDDLRFDKVGFSLTTVCLYFKKMGKEGKTERIEELLKEQVLLKKVDFNAAVLYILI